MKKINLLTLCVMAFFISLIQTSCSSDDHIYADSPEQNLNKSQISLEDKENLLRLQTSIKALSIPQDASSNNTGMRVPFWKKFWKAVATVFSDAVGAVIGSAIPVPGATVAGGTLTSGLVAHYIYGSDAEIKVKYGSDGFAPVHKIGTSFNNIIVNNYSDRTWKDSLGYYHNAVLYDFFKDSLAAENTYNLSQREFADAMLNKANGVFPTQLILNTQQRELLIQETITNSNLLINALKNAESFEDFCSLVKSEQLIDDTLFDIIVEYVNGLSQLDVENDNGQYVQDVINLINSYNLSQNTKEVLQGFVAIGQGSNHLWKEQ